MSDESEGQANPAGDEAAAANSASSFVNADGTFTKEWRNTLPEDIRNEKCLESLPDFGTAMKNYVSTQREMGKYRAKQYILPPNEKSTPEEIDAFHTALGRPKTADDYKFATPKELEEYINQDVLKEAKGIFHKLGFNQKQVDSLYALELKRLQSGIKEMADTRTKEKTEAEVVLREKWGDKYDERLHLANRMLDENVSDAEHKAMMIDIAGNNPHFADFLATMAGKFMEHKIVTTTNATEMLSIQSQIDELMKTEAYLGKTKSGGYVDQKEHLAMVQKVQRLFEQKSKLLGQNEGKTA